MDLAYIVPVWRGRRKDHSFKTLVFYILCEGHERRNLDHVDATVSGRYTSVAVLFSLVSFQTTFSWRLASLSLKWKTRACVLDGMGRSL